jgi:hypothetical protein
VQDGHDALRRHAKHRTGGVRSAPERRSVEVSIRRLNQRADRLRSIRGAREVVEHIERQLRLRRARPKDMDRHGRYAVEQNWSARSGRHDGDLPSCLVARFWFPVRTDRPHFQGAVLQ